jgi:hypothetical protein
MYPLPVCLLVTMPSGALRGILQFLNDARFKWSGQILARPAPAWQDAATGA